MSDLTFKCTSCNQEFVFTQGEQEFYQQKGLPTPTQCLICRARLKAETRDRLQYRKPKQ